MTCLPHTPDFTADPFDTVPLAAMRRGHHAIVNFELNVPACRVRQRDAAADSVVAIAGERDDDVSINSHDVHSGQRPYRRHGASGGAQCRCALTEYGQHGHNTWALPSRRYTYALRGRGGTADAPRSVNRFRV